MTTATDRAADLEVRADWHRHAAEDFRTAGLHRHAAEVERRGDRLVAEARALCPRPRAASRLAA